MATPHFRHQLHLHRPQLGRWQPGRLRRGGGRWLAAVLGLVAAIAVLPHQAQAQRFKGGELEKNRKGKITGITVQNLPAYNNRFFRPGFYIAPQLTRLFVEQSAAYYQMLGTPRAVLLNSISSLSFAAGFVGDIRLGPPATHWHLRFAPGVSFLTRRVEYAPGGGFPLPNADSIKTQEITSTQLDLPLLLKYQSNRRGNTRLYMVGGIKPSTTIGTSRNNPEINMLRAVGNDLTLEYGVGLDLFYPLFKFAPELRFSHGLTNILEPRNDVFSRSVQSLRTNTVTLYITFE